MSEGNETTLGRQGFAAKTLPELDGLASEATPEDA
jgi:hypothetical protein